ncbi:MAG: hypothetical protein ACYDIC_18190 [Desulfobaccales bacterium]
MSIDQYIGRARQSVAFLEDKLLEGKALLKEMETIKACREHGEKSGIQCPYPDFCGLTQPCRKGCPS